MKIEFDTEKVFKGNKSKEFEMGIYILEGTKKYQNWFSSFPTIREYLIKDLIKISQPYNLRSLCKNCTEKELYEVFKFYKDYKNVHLIHDLVHDYGNFQNSMPREVVNKDFQESLNRVIMNVSKRPKKEIEEFLNFLDGRKNTSNYLQLFESFCIKPVRIIASYYKNPSMKKVIPLNVIKFVLYYQFDYDDDNHFENFMSDLLREELFCEAEKNDVVKFLMEIIKSKKYKKRILKTIIKPFTFVANGLYNTVTDSYLKALYNEFIEEIDNVPKEFKKYFMNELLRKDDKENDNW